MKLIHLEVVLDWGSCQDDAMFGPNSIDTFGCFGGVLYLVPFIKYNIIL